MNMPDEAPVEAHTRYGAPARLALLLEFRGAAELNVTLQVFDKTATRLPESAWLRFTPTQPKQPSSVKWSMQKVGLDVDPLSVVINGSRHLHAVEKVSRVVSLTNGNSTKFEVNNLDVPLASFNTHSPFSPVEVSPSPFPTPDTVQPDLGKGVSFGLWNNIWGTNYVMWTPWTEAAAGESNLQFRFCLLLQSKIQL
jgi:hypothetical protein